MKQLKPTYMVLHDNDIVFPKEVQYLDDGYYLCTGPLNEKFVVSVPMIAKLSDEDFDMLIGSIHYAINNNTSRYLEIRNIDDDVPFAILVFSNGYIRCNGHSATIYVPPNYSKWDYALLKGHYSDSYTLEHCDKNGNIIPSKRKELNPYTTNCNIVYDIIAQNPGISTIEVINELGWPNNSVTSRLSELMTGGRIYSIGRIVNPMTGRRVNKWVTSNFSERVKNVI